MFKFTVIFVGTILWCFPFIAGLRKAKVAPVRRDLKARWGIALQCIAYSLLWQGPFWRMNPGAATIGISSAFFILACLLSWTGARALGRHLRLDAALDSEQTLVRSGPYRLVRHPIYSSMLGVLVGTGVLVTPRLLLLLAILVFIAGTEIRLHVEDKLLQSRFGGEFSNYRNRVRKVIPFVW
jgi:protein-S-isoprenylcysteine O-methyltransferase Ste14